MSDSIYRHDAIKAIETSRFLVDAIEKVMMLPTAQPKTGKWIPTQNPQWKAYYHDKCSVCGWWNTKNSVCRDAKKKAHSLNYCPNCGAKMKEGEEHD